MVSKASSGGPTRMENWDNLTGRRDNSYGLQVESKVTVRWEIPSPLFSGWRRAEPQAQGAPPMSTGMVVGTSSAWDGIR